MKRSFQHRNSVDFAASVTLGPQTVLVRVMDLSEDGMRIATPHRAKTGTPIYMSTPGVRLIGEVRWCHRDNIGVSFMPKLTRWQIETLRNGTSAEKNKRFSSSKLQELR